MEELVKYIVNSLVEDKQAVKVETKEDGGITIIHITVSENDAGRVIGKQGKVAESIRTIVKSASRGTNKKYAVKIN